MPRLFTYGTLQLEPIQLRLFGRTLVGEEDVLDGYRIGTLEPAGSGGPVYRTLQPDSEAPGVEGLVYEVTEADLGRADVYETEAYRRVEAVLRSGQVAWVYVDARD